MCIWQIVTRHFEALQCLHLEVQEGTTILQNVRNYLPVGTTLTSHTNGIFSYSCCANLKFRIFGRICVAHVRCVCLEQKRTYKVQTNYIQTTSRGINYSQLPKYEAPNSILICSVYKSLARLGLGHISRWATCDVTILCLCNNVIYVG